MSTMEDEITSAESKENIGPMRERTITLADGRYMIFFTFESEERSDAADVSAADENQNV